MDTPDLIRTLADNVAPVKRLRPPLLRAALWLLLAAIIIWLLVMSHGLRPQFSEHMRDGVFATGVIASSRHC